VAARHRAVDRVDDTLEADCGIGQIDEEQARGRVRLCHHDAQARAVRAGDELLQIPPDKRDRSQFGFALVVIGGACTTACLSSVNPVAIWCRWTTPYIPHGEVSGRAGCAAA